MDELRKEQLRALWRIQGGTFYGPNVEHGAMEESKLLEFLEFYEARIAALTAERDKALATLQSWANRAGAEKQAREAAKDRVVKLREALQKVRLSAYIEWSSLSGCSPSRPTFKRLDDNLQAALADSEG